jgi:hypothetical protein
MRGGEERALGARWLELERLHATGVQRVLVEQAQRQRLEARRLAGEDLDAGVVEAGVGRLLEGRRGEAGRAPALVDARRRLERVQLGKPLGLAPEIGQGPLARVLLEEANRDRDRHERRDQHPEEKDRGKPEAQRAQHRAGYCIRRRARPWAPWRPCSPRPRR